MSFYNINNKDEMWYKLGYDFCKLNEWFKIIYLKILDKQFGISHKLVKKFRILDNYLIYLASTLDDIISQDYPISLHNLESIETNPLITHIFYNLYTNNDSNQIIYNEQIDDSGINNILQFRNYPISKFPKNFTPEEKKFIDTFIKNLNEYLFNIQFLIQYNLNYKNKLDKNISKIKRYITKLIPEISQVPVFN